MKAIAEGVAQGETYAAQMLQNQTLVDWYVILMAGGTAPAHLDPMTLAARLLEAGYTVKQLNSLINPSPGPSPHAERGELNLIGE